MHLKEMSLERTLHVLLGKVVVMAIPVKHSFISLPYCARSRSPLLVLLCQEDCSFSVSKGGFLILLAPKILTV